MIQIKDKNGIVLKEIANSRYADLWFANLRNANLQNANLRNADLQNANLRNANLRNADLQNAKLRNADLHNADLQNANLQNANLWCANLRNADLWCANLRCANLRCANLCSADLQNADLCGASLPHFQVCPEEGSFIAWKKGSNNTIIKLLIHEDAKRNSCLTGRKCRASKAKVIEVIEDGRRVQECNSLYNISFIYSDGADIIPDSYDDDIRVECSHGIHFFITRKEAEEWQS